MFSKILIANRGEVACRIIRTCRQLGVQAVALFSEADRNALHVRMADEAHLLGPPAPSESYLNIPRIIDVAKKTRVDAVHPGYGFLSQSPAFARECLLAGLVFVGPTADIMERMGDKAQARKTATEAGVPVLPGTADAVDEDNAPSQARSIGYPLMVKAAGGGGGIGIQIVHNEAELLQAMGRARDLARSAFGNPKLYLERSLEGSSHVEVQVFGDWSGKVVHLYERDCSIQRRHQKLIEETPCPKINPLQRKLLTQYAVTLARHIKYVNAGTVEFLVSREGEIYFLEMNTRLQVEHGITELVTGLDLVELQLRIAAGEAIPFRQKDVKVRGHAMEGRVYAEDPLTFLPQAGLVGEMHIPEDRHVRVDSALFPGMEVTSYYDALLAKVMCWGRHRDRARRRLIEALERLQLEGIVSNIPALRLVLSSRPFTNGAYDTGLVSRLLQATSTPARAAGDAELELRRKAAVIALSILFAREKEPARPRVSIAASQWRLFGRTSQMLSRAPARGRSWR